MSNNQTPEQKARNDIDRKLNGSSWIVQEKSKIDWNASKGIAVKEYITDVGPADYVLFVDILGQPGLYFHNPAALFHIKGRGSGRNPTK